MTYRGKVKDGVIVPQNGAELPDGADVRFEVVSDGGDDAKADETEEKIPSLYERLKPIIGIAKNLPPDASERIDDYLYGRSEQS